MTFLDRLVGRVFFKTLIRRYVVAWEWPAGGDSVEAWERETVTCGGRPLAVLYGRAEGVARGVVVCVPPTTRASKGYFLSRGYGKALCAAGYDVFLFDLNGFGESPYRGIDYDADILAVGRVAARRRPGLRVGLLGVCFGASYGVLAMARPGHPFRGAVLESPYADFRAVLEAMDRHVSRTQAYRKGARLIPWIAPFFQRFNVLRQARRVVGVEGILLVACERDTIVPPESVREVARHLGTAGPCEVWEVPGGEHLRVVEAAPEGYFDRIVGLFDATLDAAERVPKRPAAPAA